MNTHVLTRVDNPAAAAAIVQLLAQEQIRAVSDGHGVVGWQMEAPAQIRIVIDEVDLARAEEVLRDWHQGNSEIDWDDVDVGQPED